MKKIFTTLTMSAAAVAVSSAQVGWDFSQFAVDGFSTTDGTTITKELSANYLDGSADFTGAPALGTLYYDGSNGSTNFEADGSPPEEVEPLGQLDTEVGNLGYLGLTGSRNALESQGQSNTQAGGFGLSTNGAFTFYLTPGEETDYSTLKYAAYNTNDSEASLAWEYSTDGGSSWTALETDTISTSEAAFEVDLSDITASDLWVRGTLSGLDSNLFALDNVEFDGDAASENQPFIANSEASSLVSENLYDTPLGEIATQFNPWVWSAEFGWMYFSAGDPATGGWVYFLSAPYQTWVFVDASAGTSEGIWSYAQGAQNSAINGWFWFFKSASEANDGDYFIWDNEGSEVLSLDDWMSVQ